MNAGLSAYLKNKVPSRVWNMESGGLIDLQNSLDKIQALDRRCGHPELILGSSVSRGIVLENSVNLSFLGAAMKIQDRFLARLEAALRGCPRSSSIIYLELLPALLSVRASDSFADKNDLKMSFILNWREILNGPPDVAMDYMILKLRNYTPPEMTVNLLRRMIFPVETKLDSASVLNKFDKMYDLKNANFDPKEISNLRSIISRSLKLTTRLVLFLPPQNYETWRYTDIAEKKIDFLLSELAQEFNISILRGDKEHFSITEFRDPLHLNSSGIDRFANLLRNQSSR